MEEQLEPYANQANTRLHENISLIQVQDRVSLDMIQSDATANKYLLTRLSDTVAVVAPGQFDALLKRLLRLGHTPRVSGKR